MVCTGAPRVALVVGVRPRRLGAVEVGLGTFLRFLVGAIVDLYKCNKIEMRTECRIFADIPKLIVRKVLRAIIKS